MSRSRRKVCPGAKLRTYITPALIAREYLATLNDNLDLWLTPDATPHTTLVNSSSQAIKFLSWCRANHYQAVPVSVEHWDLYVEKCRESTLSNATYNRWLQVVKWLHTMAHAPKPQMTQKQAMLQSADRRNGRLNAVKSARPMRWEELNELCSPSSEKTTYREDAALAAIRVMYDGANRSAEIVGYRWDQLSIDEETGAGYIKLIKAKNDQYGEGTERYISPETVAYLLRFRAKHGLISDYLIPNIKRPGSPVVAKTVQSWVSAYGKRHDIDVTTHSMRRGVVQDMIAAGFDSVYIADYVGWKGDVRLMVAHYSRGMPAKDSAACKLNRLNRAREAHSAPSAEPKSM